MPGKKGNRPWVHLHCQGKRKRSKRDKEGNVVTVEAKCNEHNYVSEKNKRNSRIINLSFQEQVVYTPNLYHQHTPHLYPHQMHDL